MTLPRLKDLTAYWKNTPPAHFLLAGISAALGIAPAPDRDTEEDQKEVEWTPGTRPHELAPGELSALYKDHGLG